MAKKSKAQIQFEADTSGFTQGIKDADRELSTLRKELALNAAELKENADDVDLLSERKEILQRESKAAADKIEALQNKLESAKATFGENSNEVYQLNKRLLDAQTAFQKIQNETTQVEKKMSSLDTELNQVEQGMNEVDKSADNLSDGFTTMKGVMADLIADGVQELSGALKDLAIDNDTAMSNFQAQTGTSAEAMKEFEGAIETMYSKNYGESINDIANSMAEVKQQTKEVDPSKLQSMTENALMLRDTFDFDVSESMRGVNSLMNQFGISSDEAFNLVVQGAQGGLNANGDMLDVINEYSVQFKNAGFDANDMFNMLMNGAEEGTWSVDKLGDAVKEMNIRMSDGTVAEALEEHGLKVDDLAGRYGKGGESAQQAMQDVMNAIMSVEDENERYKLGVEVFGTMYEDLGEDAVKALMSTEGSIDSAKGAMEELTSVKTDNITTQIGQLGRMIQTDFLIPIVETLLPPLKTGLQWISDNLNWLLPVITAVGIAIGTYFVVAKIMGFINGIKTLITLIRSGTTVMGALNVVMSLNPIALVVAAIVGLIAAFVLLWNKCDGFREFWINLWEKIKFLCSSAINGIKNGFSAFKEFMSNLWTSIKTKAVDTWTSLKSNITEKVSSIKNSVVDKFNAIKNGISEKINGAKDKVKSAIDKIKGFFNFKFSWPKIPLPKFSIKPKGWKIGDLLEGSIPKLSISWNAQGAIFKKPTIFNTANGLQGVGEAGAEAVLPLAKLESWINSGFTRIVNNNYYGSEKLDRLIEVAENILAKPSDTYLNGRKVSEGLAGDNDDVNGLRYNFKGRGVIL